MATICEEPGLWDQVLSAPYLSREQWRAANLIILCQLVGLAGTPPTMASCTIAGLWDQVKGNPPFISEQEFMAENLNLLCQLLAAGGGGGGIDWITWEDTGPTPAGPPADATKAAMVRFRDGNPPVVWDPVAADWR